MHPQGTSNRYIVAFVLLLLALSSVSVPAQLVTGVIHGRIVDATQGVIPGVVVKAGNMETSLEREVVSDDGGFYHFEALPPGIYTISAELTGFKKAVRPNVKLAVGEPVRVDLQLEVGEVSQSVTVQADVLMVNTRTAEMSGLVDDKRITDLPLSGRNVISLASLIPGVSTVTAPQVQTGSRSGPKLTVHGSRANQNYFSLNGAYFNHSSRNTGMNPPPPDAVREFRIKTNNFSAAEGRNAGSIVSIATRSGTNTLHGAIWEFHRNSTLNARSFFQTVKPHRIQNQFGAAAGGPIIKGKIFVFGTYEGFRDRPQASSTNAFPPTAEERAGDFSSRSRQLRNPFTGQSFTGNQVPTTLFDPASLKILQLIPAPNTPDGRLVTNNPSPINNELMMIRSDFQISDKQNFFVHYYYNRNELPPRIQGNIPGWMESSTQSRFHNVGFSHTYIFSHNLLNSFTFGTNPAKQQVSNSRFRSTESLGMDYPNYTDYGAPQFNVSGRFSLRASANDAFKQDAYNFHEAMSWTRGNHIFKYGGEFFRLAFRQEWLSPPSFSFNGARSGDVMLDFLLGAWRSNSVGYGRRLNDTLQPWYWSLYFADEWKVTPRLTLNLGMRYELPSPWNDRREIGLSSVVFPIDKTNVTKAPLKNAPPGYLFANFDLPAGLVRADKNNFAPRLGIVYDVTGDGRTSIRTGFGVFYDTANADTLAQVNPPFAGTQGFSNGRLSAPKAGITQPLPNVNPRPEEGGFDLPMNPFSTDMGLRNSYMMHWNIGFQRQINPDLMLSVDYVGKIGRKLLAFWPWNPAVFIPGNDAQGNPRSTLENVDDRVRYGKGIYGAYYNLMLSGMFDSWYHGLDVEVNKRLSDGFSVLTSYTLSKAIDENSTDNLGGDSPNPFNPKRSERGLAQFDRRHVVAVSALLSPYAGRTLGSPLGRLTSGWTFSPIFRYTSGPPLEFFIGEDRALNGTSDGSEQHPVAVIDPKKSHDSNNSKVSSWFNTDAFVLPALGTYGNAAKGLIRGPSFVNWDLAILRDFHMPITEESRIQFRAEFFNLFNNTNFGSPDRLMLSARFGRITSSGPGREIQFGLKVLW